MNKTVFEILTIHSGMMAEGLSCEEAIALIVVMKYPQDDMVEFLKLIMKQHRAEAHEEGYEACLDELDREGGVGINYA